MQLDLEKVRMYAKKADNRALLDRVTVFQQGMEPAAIEIIKKELLQRGISPADISQHEIVYKDLIPKKTLFFNKISFMYHSITSPTPFYKKSLNKV